MQFENLHWLDTSKEVITGNVDGVEVSIPIDPKNRHYAEIKRLGLVIADPE